MPEQHTLPLVHNVNNRRHSDELESSKDGLILSPTKSSVNSQNLNIKNDWSDYNYDMDYDESTVQKLRERIYVEKLRFNKQNAQTFEKTNQRQVKKLRYRKVAGGKRYADYNEYLQQNILVKPSLEK